MKRRRKPSFSSGLLACCLTGMMLALFSKVGWHRRTGSGMVALGLLSLMATPWTLLFLHQCVGHLLGARSVCRSSGHRLLPMRSRATYLSANCPEVTAGPAWPWVGVLWLEAMHWWVLTPTYPGEVNRYWLIFWPTMLLGVLACGAGAAIVVGLVGEDRLQERRLMVMLAGFSAVLLLLGSVLDGPNVQHEVFASEVLLAAADLFGALVGAAAAAGVCRGAGGLRIAATRPAATGTTDR